MHLTSRWALGAAGAAVAGALVLAAYGGSGSSHTAAPAAATSATTAPPAAASMAASTSGPTVTTKHDPELGPILADARGLTLYTLTSNGRAVDCAGGCQAVWPPLTATSGGAPTGDAGVGTLGTASLSDGTRVVTAGGLPLYRFAQDHDSEDAYGEGISSFGGIWHVVRAGQTTAATTRAATGRMTAGY